MRVLVPAGSEFLAQGSADPIAEILNKSKTIAVVGLSSNPMRPSHGVSELFAERRVSHYSGEPE